MRWIRRKHIYDLNLYGLPLPIAQVLSARGISPEESPAFLEPRLEDLNDPFLMRDMDKAVERIIIAMKESQKIMVHGDYDVDGVTSLSLLYRNLTSIGLNVIPYIPDRFTEGYGLSSQGIEKAKEEGISLIITVDCGITALEEIEMARKYGIDVIVTDHHEPRETLPEATAIINPKVDDYPFKDLAGVGVAFKLLEALYRKLSLNLNHLYWDLDLVALGTVADIVPLVKENRVFVHFGLKILEKSKKAGIKSLKSVTGLNGKVEPWHISFILAPRLNAAGRLNHAIEAFKLLSTRDGLEALQLARELDRTNKERQGIERKILSEAEKMVRRMDLDKDWVIVLGSENWHEGVIGIVASKLVEQYNRPTILLSFTGGIGKGSGRSIQNFNLFNALLDLEKYLLSFGGHKMAAGLRLEKENLQDFRQALNKLAKERLKKEYFEPELYIDGEIRLSDINQDILSVYRKLSPFGMGNPQPVFVVKNVTVKNDIRVMKDRHISFTLKQEQIERRAIAFDAMDKREIIQSGKPLNFAVQVSENNRNGEIEFKVLDVKYGD
ncbi:MAG TPA: single-stranded-DNA-specific exonuclease RecJ [candidate division WOR-3 bacterium]|uniref:Single-stranded-DNA-specific exonuclease RecJ n=1 Tax=candidate division WOR-3 bacterium TaxID=2052148 RepID=A0A7V0LUP0_UNCW3|nr:single-stranded-DNA-specific exonuclease RecJ [candidate division WOR-3 bacterium]